MTNMKTLVKKIVNAVGFDLRRHEDAFSEQKRILGEIGRPIIFDVGAHFGAITRVYRSLFPLSTIYAFEPFPDSYERLQEDLKGMVEVYPFKIGLSDKKGLADFRVNRSSATNSLFETDERASETWGAGRLETKATTQLDFTTLDDFLDAQKIECVDILKLDVQGAEFKVLEGAREALTNGRIKLVYSEIITLPTYKGQKSFHEILSLFESHGLWLHNFYNLSTVNGRLRQVDAIFTKRG